MKSITIFVFAAVVALAQAGGESFWKGWTALYLMSDCLTPEGTKNWIGLVEQAQQFCERNPVNSTDDSYLATADYQGLVNEFYNDNLLSKEPATYKQDRTTGVKNKVKEYVDNFRCVMKQIKVMKPNNDIDPDYLFSLYQDIKLAPTLEKGIQNAIYDCHKFANCYGNGLVNPLVPVDVIKMQHFLVCEMHIRYGSCMKDHIKGITNKFDFKGLDGRMGSLDAPGKAAAILMMEDKVGNWDFGLYE